MGIRLFFKLVAISYRHAMKGISLFRLHPRERPSGARPYGASWRLTPECELFEWALLDANKSGTAENIMSSSLWMLEGSKQTELFLSVFRRFQDRKERNVTCNEKL